MTILPFQINEGMSLYNRVAKIKPSSILETEKEEPMDRVNISSEATKKQVLSQTRNEVLERIRDAR